MKRLFLILILLGLGCLLMTLSAHVAGDDNSAAIYLPLALGQPVSTLFVTPSPTGTPIPTLIRIAPSCVQYDAPGDERYNLNEEYVCFENAGQEAVQMTGWRVTDAADAVYTFPVFALGPQAIVKLHTGSGSDTAADLYWGLNRAVWNNDGDTVSLYDALGTLIDRYAYD